MSENKSFIFYAKRLEAKSYHDEKTGKTKYFVEGHIDSEELDLVNDVVTRGCMTDIDSQFKSKTVKLDLDHETLLPTPGGDEFSAKLNLTRIPLGKAIESKLDKKGNHVKFELNPSWKKFDSKGNVVMEFNEVWENVQEGYYDAFSIAYIPTEITMEQRGNVKARLLDKVNLINVALTGNAINPDATLTSVMAKSLEYLKQKKSYEKDGAHAHTENDPLGLHNHPEIEKYMKSEFDYLYSRINSLSESLYELRTDESASPGMKSKKHKKGENKMSDEKANEGATKDGAAKEDVGTEKQPEGKQPEGKQPEGSGEGTPSSEAKPEGKAFADLKSQVGDLTKEMKSMKETFEKVEKFLSKALPSGQGAADPSKVQDAQLKATAEVKARGANTLDLI